MYTGLDVNAYAYALWVVLFKYHSKLFYNPQLYHL